MARIEVEVDLEEHLYEIETDDLVNELAKRKGTLNSIRVLLGLREWHNKEDIIKEIDQL
jgi:hypothetical protein